MMMIKKSDGFNGERAIIMPPKIIKQYEDKELTQTFHITDMGYYPKAKYHYRDRPEGAPEHILIHCVEGKGSASIKGEDFLIQPNDFLVIPAGYPHMYRTSADYPWTIYWLHFKGSQTEILVRRLYEKMLLQKNKIMYNEAHISLFSKIYDLLQQGYSRENMEYIALTLPAYFGAYLYNDKFNFGSGGHEEDVTDVAIRFLKSRLAVPTTLKEIAGHVHLSVSHFSNIFHRKTGYSPIEYFNHLKIQRACQLLQFTNQRIFEIALAIGIEDPYYFSRLFSAHMGMSPKNYRSRWSIHHKP